jgi:hypothetical protein
MVVAAVHEPEPLQVRAPVRTDPVHMAAPHVVPLAA